MATTRDKNWRFFTIDQTGGDMALSAKATFIQMKADLKSATLPKPWTVVGSSNGTTSSMDGTDRVTNFNTDIVSGSNGVAHSWVVMSQSAMNGFSICWDFNDSTVINYREMSIVVSPRRGFGTANGGTNGSHLNRPTATDEVVVIDRGVWLFGTLAANASHNLRTMVSDDGKNTRILIGTGGYCQVVAMFEELSDPVDGWSHPYVFGWYTSGTPTSNAGTTTNLNGATGRYLAYHTSSAGAITGSVGLSATGYASTLCGTTLTASNDLSGFRELYPVYFASLDPQFNQILGAATDLYFGDSTIVMNDSFDSFQWVGIPTLVVPWTTSASIAF